MPIALDEFHQRSMIGITMRYLSAPRVLGYCNQRDARAITEKVDRLEEAGVPVSAAFAIRGRFISFPPVN